MKQTLLFTFLLTICQIAICQNFSVSSQVATQQGGLGQELSPSVVLRNLSNRPIELQWELDRHNLPQDWTAQVCEKTCRDISNKNNTFVLAPNEIVSNFRINFTPNASEGIAFADVRIFETQKRSSTELMISFSAAAQQNNSATTRPVAQRVFPNPATEFIMLQDDNNTVKHIEIYNIIGRKIGAHNVGSKDEKYDIANLPQGMYMVRMLDGKGNIVRTQRISKNNP
jgi:hypothetical protein